jgi:hypothetical protein
MDISFTQEHGDKRSVVAAIDSLLPVWRRMVRGKLRTRYRSIIILRRQQVGKCGLEQRRPPLIQANQIEQQLTGQIPIGLSPIVDQQRFD